MTSDDAEASLSSAAVLNPEANKPATCPGSNQGKRRKRQVGITGCPAPWVTSNNGHCYLVHENTLSFNDGASYCRLQNANAKMMRFYDVADFMRIHTILYTVSKCFT